MRPIHLAILVPLVLSAIGPSSGKADDDGDYLGRVKPLLAERCFACHAGLKQQAGLRLDTALSARQGGDSGPAIVPGESAGSLLIDRVTATDESVRMPPAGEGAALSPEEVALVASWINSGAAGPADERPEQDPRAHWAFQQPSRPMVPVAGHTAWVENPIDAFVAAEHAAHGLTPTPSATREALLRRVHLDLTGLPPTRGDLQSFREDTSPDAYDRVVERLLAGPQYGERWGRHWMDVWRYCDWYGNAGSGSWWNSGCEIWRWRDWIVRSLNEDRGYDRMVMDMLAADELSPTDDASIVATGYIVRNWYALNYNAWKRDLVEHTGKAFLGLTFNCCHCHDHKYDPISQREYFRFRAFFEPLELRLDRVPGTPDPGRFVPYGAASGGAESFPVKGGMIRVVDAFPDEPTRLYRGGDERDVADDVPPLAPGAPAFLGGDALPITPVIMRPEAWYPALRTSVMAEDLHKADEAIAAAESRLDAADDDRGRALPAAEVESAQADRESLVARIAAEHVRYLHAPGDLESLSREASRAERQANVAREQLRLLRAQHALADAEAASDADGLAKAQAELKAAETGMETATQAAEGESQTYSPLGPQYVTSSTGRRAALARWIASPDNPLTARVAVNHIWMRHFGRPLVESVYNFGRNGKPPSHPALLDWLAVEFMDSGWSMKHLHRLMVTSQTYRQASAGGDSDGVNEQLDPDNRFLWRFAPRRVESEVIRDSVLAVAGELDSTIGGADLPVDQELSSRRRGLYFNVRPIGFAGLSTLASFDTPNPGECYRRSESVMPQQALALTNGQLVLAHGRSLARRLSAEVAASACGDGSSEGPFVVAAYETVLGRSPTPPERQVCQEFLRQQAELFISVGSEGLPTATPEGVPPPAMEPAARAREGLIRALLNHTEFVTIR